MMKRILIVLLAALAGQASMLQAAPAEAAASAERTEAGTDQPGSEPAAADRTSGTPADAAAGSLPEASQLLQRALGDAFRNFKPSEEISADNAVSFPVDI